MSASMVYVGTYPRAYHSDTEDSARGIYVFRAGNGQNLVQVLDAVRTGWLVMHPTGTRLYALNEVRTLDGVEGGAVTEYAVDPRDGRLTELGRRRTAASPCHAALDPSGRVLIVTTFHGGVVHAFPIGADGALQAESARIVHTGSSLHPMRQRSPHPHGVVFDPSGRFVFVPDLGTDRVEVHRVDAASGTLSPVPDAGAALTPGSGPRHIVLHPEAALAYVVNEMSATVTTLAYHQDGRLTPLSEDALLPDDVPGIRSGGEILMHPSGAWLYVTHRSHGSSGPRPGGGEDCIVRFRIDASTGRPHDPVRIASGGSIPRTAAFRDGGAGLRVGHQGSGTIVDFDIDPVEGTLYPTGVVIDTPVPVCVIVA